TVTDDVQKKAIDATPVVMVFGVYNAGKSTLLNAMLGEERASMADKPETDKVTPYEWRGFTILDTPGIDAPIEHEKVSREQLERSDVVLFVLSNDGTFEEQKTYDEMCDILAAKKPLLVIVNNKSGQSEADPDYRHLYDTVANNLNAAAEQRKLSQKASIFLINAKTALKGRLENKEQLVIHSNLPALENAVENRLKDCDASEIASVLGERVKSLIDEALKKLDQREKSPESQLLAGLQESVQGEKLRTRAAITLAIRSVVNNFRQSYRVAAESGDESRAKAAFENAISGATHAIEKELGIANDNLIALGERLTAAALAVNTDSTSLSLPTSNNALTDQGDSKPLFPVEDVMRGLTSKLTQEGVQQATKTAVHATLTLAKDWLPSLMKGVGVKTIEKMAEGAGQLLGKAVPFIGPAISIISGIRDYYKAQEAEQAQIRQMEAQARAIQDAVEQQATRLEREFEDGYLAAIKQAFAPIETAFIEQSRALDQKSQALTSDRAALESIKYRLSSI
ncbi:GTPase, partial [Chromatium okenii]|uniref:GTPase n=1 Tax=Chromatium okenii TaxID=61644 RepID=UPI0026EBE31B